VYTGDTGSNISDLIIAIKKWKNLYYHLKK
jgi:hypothetical protein